jgi:hypothetical protein
MMPDPASLAHAAARDDYRRGLYFLYSHGFLHDYDIRLLKLNHDLAELLEGDLYP